MNDYPKWTLIDETIHCHMRKLELELRRTHGVLFAAAFIDEFEPEIRSVALYTVAPQLPALKPPT